MTDRQRMLGSLERYRVEAQGWTVAHSSHTAHGMRVRIAGKSYADLVPSSPWENAMRKISWIVAIIALVGLTTPPPVASIPGGSGAPTDSGLTTKATYEIEIASIIINGAEKECTASISERGIVEGDLNVVTYSWSVPGDSDSGAGPIFEVGLDGFEVTVPFGDYIGSFHGSASIKAEDLPGPVSDLDEAVATDSTAKVKCGEDASPPDTDSLMDCLLRPQDDHILEEDPHSFVNDCT